jgi:thioredoxin 1
LGDFKIFEAIMLLCFGVSWPISIYKSYTSRKIGSKSVVFLYAILIGYVAGIINKILYSPDLVLFLYIINLILVMIDTALYYRNLHIEKSEKKAKIETIVEKDETVQAVEPDKPNNLTGTENNKDDQNQRRNQPMSVTAIKESEFDTAVLKAEGLVIVDFYADWCGPCKMLSPVIDEIASEHPEVKCFKINVDDNQGVAAEYGVMSIPTIVFIKNGELISTEVGVRPKQHYLELIAQYH